MLTSPVGRFPPNGYGLYDMAGNVWEWCLDEYQEDFYQRSPKNNPFAGGDVESVVTNFLNIKTNRVTRSGSWDNEGIHLRVTERFESNPTKGTFAIGFRCAKSVSL